jgi:hypothetical protein
VIFLLIDENSPLKKCIEEPLDTCCTTSFFKALIASLIGSSLLQPLQVYGFKSVTRKYANRKDAKHRLRRTTYICMGAEFLLVGFLIYTLCYEYKSQFCLNIHFYWRQRVVQSAITALIVIVITYAWVLNINTNKKYIVNLIRRNKA